MAMMGTTDMPTTTDRITRTTRKPTMVITGTVTEAHSGEELKAAN